jgi:hypothetical protein
MTAALDLGSSEFRSLRREEERLIARRLPAVYTTIDDQPAHRRLLDQTQIGYSVTAGSLVVIGDAAVEVSSLLSRPLIPLLHEGLLAEQDPVGRQVCAWLIELLLPAAGTENSRCYLTLPRGETMIRGIENSTAQYLEHIVQLRGYQTTLQNPAAALAVAELEDQEFTGACLTVGAESITFAVTHFSQPILQTRCQKGAREVLERYGHSRKKYIWDQSGNTYLDQAGIHAWLSHPDLSLATPRSDDETWLAEAFEELLLSAWFSIKRKFLSTDDRLLQDRLPLVISGGPTRLPGFVDLVVESLKLSGLPLRVSDVRTATFDPYSVARGLLIQATLASGESIAEMMAVEAA